MNHAGIALITGASSGIGAAFARALAEEAAHAAEGRPRVRGLPRFDELWLVARRKDRLEALAAELETKKLGLRVIQSDITADGAVASLADAATLAGKPLRILVNNAGYGTYGTFSSVNLERQLGLIDLNCRALTECCGRFDRLLERGSLVLNVASLAAFAPLGNFAAYAASKAYVLSFSAALAAEWEERGVRVCALCPGPVTSEFALVASNGARKEVSHGWPAEETVRRALIDAADGRAISVPRFTWRLQRFLAGLVGPSASARLTFRFMTRPHAEDSST